MRFLLGEWEWVKGGSEVWVVWVVQFGSVGFLGWFGSVWFGLVGFGLRQQRPDYLQLSQSQLSLPERSP